MYLDPGFGSLIIQMIVAAIAGLGAYLALAKKKALSIFSKNNKTNTEENHEEGI